MAEAPRPPVNWTGARCLWLLWWVVGLTLAAATLEMADVTQLPADWTPAERWAWERIAAESRPTSTLAPAKPTRASSTWTRRGRTAGPGAADCAPASCRPS